MKNRITIDIDAPPERVFYWLEDAKRVMQWVPNLVENEDVEVTPTRVGSTSRQVYLEGSRRMEMTGVVTAFEANRHLAMAITGDMFNLDVEYHLEPTASGTRLTQDSRVRFKGVWMIFGPLVTLFASKSSAREADESFAELKRLAEADESAVKS